MSAEIPQIESVAEEEDPPSLSWLGQQLLKAVEITQDDQRRRAVEQTYFAAEINEIPVEIVNLQYILALEKMEPWCRKFADELQLWHSPYGPKPVQIWPVAKNHSG